jgi:hypothetical protein
MNQVFAELLCKCVIVFVDNILIYSADFTAHLAHLCAILTLLHQHGLLVKYSKCSFAKQELEYLGHITGKDGVATDKSKVTAVLQWPPPKTMKALRGFFWD